MFTRNTIISGLATIVALGVSAGPAMAHPAEATQAAPVKQQTVKVDRPAALPKGVVLRRTFGPHGVGQRTIVVTPVTPIARPDDRADRGIPATRIVPEAKASDSSGFSTTDVAVICGVILAALSAMWLATRRVGGERYAQ
jgi:hypothetical protein